MIATGIAKSAPNGPPGLLRHDQQQPVLLLITYFTVDLTMGIANAKVIPNTSSFMGVSQGQAPHVEHPEFNATTNQGMTALQDVLRPRRWAAVAAGELRCD